MILNFHWENIREQILYSFLFVFLAGLFGSFGAVIVRYMVDGHLYQAQYLFCRGISIAIILVTYLFIREVLNFYKNFENYENKQYFTHISALKLNGEFIAIHWGIVTKDCYYYK